MKKHFVFFIAVFIFGLTFAGKLQAQNSNKKTVRLRLLKSNSRAHPSAAIFLKLSKLKLHLTNHEK